jgi:hypothetical protein
MKYFKVFLIAFCLAASTWTFSHELATHARITLQAYQLSNLAVSPKLITDLGIETLLQQGGDTSRYPDGVFGDTYYDIQGSTISLRKRTPFEDGIINSLNLDLSVTNLPSWLMHGAIREDDGGHFLGLFRMGLNSEPYDDPYGNINRYCNHFYDPLTGRGATFFCPGDSPLGAPVWALGALDPFSSPNTPNLARRNHFTIVDARKIGSGLKD